MANTTSSGQTWDERYSEDGFAFGTEPNDFLREVVEQLPRGRTLCLATARGATECFSHNTATS